MNKTRALLLLLFITSTTSWKFYYFNQPSIIFFYYFLIMKSSYSVARVSLDPLTPTPASDQTLDQTQAQVIQSDNLNIANTFNDEEETLNSRKLAGVDDERLFLIDFMNSTNAKIKLPGWANTTLNQRCTSTYFTNLITCQDGYIVRFDLMNRQITGTIPSSIGFLTRLTYLRLDQNSFYGTLPSQISLLPSLKYLYLASNLFLGPLPASLSTLSNLIVVDANTNSLNGTIPSFQGGSLSQLILGKNSFMGSIPNSFFTITALARLLLYDNKLTGSMSSNIGSLGFLSSFLMYSNLMVGSLPSEMGSLTALRTLNMRANRFTGSIPASFASLTALTALSLHQNSFNGVYPPSLCTIVSTFTLTSSSLQCVMPTSFPTQFPTIKPTLSPSSTPTLKPSTSPSTTPTFLPSRSPTFLPSATPSTSPTFQPSSPPTLSPTYFPSTTPTFIPSSEPTIAPTLNPSTTPTLTPTILPSFNPTVQPSFEPSFVPSFQPTTLPSEAPTVIPSFPPTSEPTNVPTYSPSTAPSFLPTTAPTFNPTTQPTFVPSSSPTFLPSSTPTLTPSSFPSFNPTVHPTEVPTITPSSDPTSEPTNVPTYSPSTAPSFLPTTTPTFNPTVQPTFVPSSSPTFLPSSTPTVEPSSFPSFNPTTQPTFTPSSSPTFIPSSTPTLTPSSFPSISPTIHPTEVPTITPSSDPTSEPTNAPTCSPSTVPTFDPTTIPTLHPTVQPSFEPSYMPSFEPSLFPTFSPSMEPSNLPSSPPSVLPSHSPTDLPSYSPSTLPTQQPSLFPSAAPTTPPTHSPTAEPTTTVYPTSIPSLSPTFSPTESPTLSPTSLPSLVPTVAPSTLPSTSLPTELPTVAPTTAPTLLPTIDPTLRPTSSPSTLPTSSPTENPSLVPSTQPTLVPTSIPSSTPSLSPTDLPTFLPSTVPSSALPTPSPSNQPTFSPTTPPTILPSARPSLVPSFLPSTVPSINPTSITAFPTTSPTYSTPILTSCTFSSELTTIWVIFDSPTDKGQQSLSFPCKSQFSFLNSDTSTCTWDADGITLSVFNFKTLNVGDQINLLPNVLRSSCGKSGQGLCSSYPFSSSQSCLILPPPSPIIPTVIISSASVIGSLDNYLLDLSSSTGSGGRSWQIIDISVIAYQGKKMTSSPILITSEKLQPLQDYLQNNLNSTKVIIPSFLFQTNYTYDFTVTLCNFLYICSLSQHKSLYIESFPVPVITLYGPSIRQIKRSEILSVSAFASLNTSQGTYSSNQLNNGLLFTWEIFDNSTLLPFTSLSKDQTKLRIPSFSFQTGRTYQIHLKVASILFTNSKAVTTTTVMIIQSKIIARINNNQQMYLLKQGNTLLLNATSSYDEDMRGVTGTQAGLSFDWSCVEYQKINSTENCLTYFSIVYNEEKSEAVVTSLGGSLVDWVVVLRVSSTAFNTLRTSTTSVIIREILPSSPTLSLNGPNRINQDSTLVLFGIVNTTSTVKAVWSSETITNLNSLLLTPTELTLSKGSHKLNLVLPRNTLIAGSSYIFQLSIQDTPTMATITVSVPSAPKPGILDITPNIGTAYQHLFQFQALYWSDNELPLTYSYGYYSTSRAIFTLLSRTESTSLNTLLPVGEKNQGYLLLCYVIVYNNLNVTTRYNTTVVVNPDSSSNRNLVLNSILSLATPPPSTNTDRLDKSEVDTIRQQIFLGSSILNTVNCSLIHNCHLLNREECGQIDNQCGPCLNGYVAIDSTDPYGSCVIPGSLSIPSGDICVNSHDCSNLQTCQNNTCVFLKKSCGFDCNGHGLCHFEQTSNAKRVDICYENDPTCRAFCECEDGYTGLTCSLELLQMQTLQQNRYLLIKSLNYTISYGDFTKDEMTSLLGLILDLSSRPYELTSVSCSLLIDMVRSVIGFITTTKELNLNYQDVMSLFPIFNTCLTLLTDEQTKLEFNSVMEEFIQSISLTLIDGISSQSLIQSSLRMTTITQSLESDESLSLMIPSTTLESALGTPKTSITYSTSQEFSASISLVEKLARFESYENISTNDNHRVEGTSNSLSLIVNRFDTLDSSNQEVQATFKIVLHYNEEQVYGNITGTNISFTTRCNDTTLRQYHCPSGQIISHDCSLHKGYILTSVCSILTSSPSCGIINGNDNENDHNQDTICYVSSFTTRNTTCICEMPFSSSQGRRERGRKLKSSENNEVKDTGAVTIMSMTDYTFSGVYETVMDSDDITAGDIRASYLVLTMFLVLWGVGTCCLVEDLRITENWFASSKKRDNNQHRSALIKNAIVPLDESIEIRKKYLVTYLNSIFPEVFYQEGTTWKALLGELRKHHRYITIFIGGGTFSHELRVKTLLQILTVQTMLMFVLAVCYDLQYPSNTGQCAHYTTEDDCLEPSSLFDSSQRMCQWETNSNEGDKCLYLKPNITLQMIVLISILVATITAPFNLFVDFLFDIIRAPTADSARFAEVISSGNTSIQRAGRRVSSVALNASKAIASQVNNLIPVSNGTPKRQQKSRLQTIFHSFVHDVTRDVPQTVVHRHALASNALGNSFRETREFRQRSSLATKKIAIAPHNRDVEDPETEIPETLNIVRRKQRATIFLADVSSIRHIEANMPSPSVSSSNLVPFSPIAPGTSPSNSEQKLDSSTQLYQSLITELFVEYNKLTAISQREEFIQKWGWNPDSKHFNPSSRNLCFPSTSSDHLVRKELQAVQEKIKQKERKLRSATDMYIGMEIMHQFAIDLLGKGTPAAIIFETTISEEFKYSWVVTRSFKILAWVMFVFVNLFFVYFCLLRAMNRDRNWQESYLIACVFQLVVEVCVYESLECLWIHYGIPSIVAEEVETTINQIHETIDGAFSLEPDATDSSSSSLDAPSYFFVSTNLAEIFPKPFESGVVSAYKSMYPSPGGYVHNFRQGTHSPHHENIRENGIWRVLKRIGFTAFLTSLIQQIGTFNVRLQKLFIHVLQPIIVAFLFLAWAKISSSLILSIFACMILIVIGMAIVRWLLSKRHSVPEPLSPRQRRVSSQSNKYTNSLRNITISDAINHPSSSVPSNDDDEGKNNHSQNDQVEPITSSPPQQQDDLPLHLPRVEREGHVHSLVSVKSEDEKADNDSESWRGSSYSSKLEAVHSSTDLSVDPYEKFSSFEVDDEHPRDPYDISESSDVDDDSMGDLDSIASFD